MVIAQQGIAATSQVLASQAAAQILAFGRLLPGAEMAAAIEAVTPEDIARLAARL